MYDVDSIPARVTVVEVGTSVFINSISGNTTVNMYGESVGMSLMYVESGDNSTGGSVVVSARHTKLEEHVYPDWHSSELVHCAHPLDEHVFSISNCVHWLEDVHTWQVNDLVLQYDFAVLVQSESVVHSTHDFEEHTGFPWIWEQSVFFWQFLQTPEASHLDRSSVKHSLFKAHCWQENKDGRIVRRIMAKVCI